MHAAEHSEFYFLELLHPLSFYIIGKIYVYLIKQFKPYYECPLDHKNR